MRRPWLLLLAVVGIAALLVACESDDESPTGTAGTPTISPNGTQSYTPFTAADCTSAAPPTVSIRPTTSPVATPLSAGTVITPDTAIPETWPTEHITQVTPPDGTSVHVSDVGVSTGPGITMRVMFEFRRGSGFNEDTGLRFGLDGQDVTTLMPVVGTTDVPQSGGTANYEERLTLGDHTAALSYCDNAGKAYEYTWSFSVIE